MKNKLNDYIDEYNLKVDMSMIRDDKVVFIGKETVKVFYKTIQSSKYPIIYQ